MESRKSLVLLLACLIFTAFRAYAEDRPPYTLEGVGATTCGVFADFYGKNTETTEIIYYSWAQGFMSGSNLRLGPTKRPKNLNGISIVDQEAFLRNYCSTHALENFAIAAAELYQSLPDTNIDK